jgi:hypothetical protein
MSLCAADRIVRDHTVINAGGSGASFRRMDDAEVGAAIALGAKANVSPQVSKRDQTAGR